MRNSKKNPHHANHCQNDGSKAEIPEKDKSMAHPTKAELFSSSDLKLTAENRFPIVGIGASAGGLAAFEAFFAGMPPVIEPGMAFVLVQHLAPDHKSILTDLIKRYTRMEVCEVEDGMKVKTNCTYIIPPNRDMALTDGTLRLFEIAPARALRLPIDYFFRSLAQDQRDHAICVILSGTGSDGTLGLRAIKGEGGMAMVQTITSAEFDGMPRSALETGLVDFVLPPDKMASQLITYVSRMFSMNAFSDLRLFSEKDAEQMKIVFTMLRSHSGHDFSGYKPNTIHRRLNRRMVVNKIAMLDEYVLYLQQNPNEIHELFCDLLIGVTSFFRDDPAFLVLEKQIIPKIFATKTAESTVRIWVPGCATGEEACSIAILCREYIDTMKLNVKIQVFASDIDRTAIERARVGIYSLSIAMDITPERLARFFTKEPDDRGYRVQKWIRDIIIFSEQDMIKDPPFSKLDLISCRNVMIYMGSELQKKLIPLFHYALTPGSYLFLGTSETVGDYLNLFTTLDRKAKIYQRKEASLSGAYPLMGRPFPTTIGAPQFRPVEKVAKDGRLQPRELAERTILQNYAPVGVLVNDSGEILHLQGRTGEFLEPAPGEPVMNILKMAREDIRHHVAVGLRQARATKNPVRITNLEVKIEGELFDIDLIVHPIFSTQETPIEVAYYLIIFEKGEKVDKNRPAERLPSGGSMEDDAIDLDARIITLRQQLKVKEGFLEASNEELETSNEELKSSNEEMQSINEELQSSNEELETSKEELQSVNEELSTVNAELQVKVSDLSRINNDMNNLLAGTGIGTIFVDHGLRIQRFTPAVTQVINLIPSDLGRPLSHIVSNLKDYTVLVKDIQSVLDNLIPIDREVQTKKGSWFLLHIRPYRTLDNVIEGAVITFVDFTAMKRAREVLRLNEERMRVALQNARVVIFNQDRDLRYVWIGNSYLGLDSREILGKTDAQLLPDHAASLIIAMKQRVLDLGVGLRQEVNTVINGINYIYDLIIEPLFDATGVVTGITGVAADITQQVTIEKALQDVENKNRWLLQATRQAVVVVDALGKIIEVNSVAERILDTPTTELIGLLFTDSHLRFIHQDGSDVSVDVNPVMKALLNGYEVYGAVMGLASSSKENTIWLRVSVFPQLRPGESRPFQVYAIFEEITES